MRAFKVDLNGKRICVAGVGKNGVLTTVVSYVGHGRSSRLDFAVSGLFAPTREHAIWKSLGLKVGDKIGVMVIETDSVDKPKKRYRAESAATERNQKVYVRALAKKFGWRIVTPPQQSK